MSRYTCPHCGIYRSDKTSNFKRHVSTCVSAKLDESINQRFHAEIPQAQNMYPTFGSQIMTPDRMVEARQSTNLDDGPENVKEHLDEEGDIDYLPRERKMKSSNVDIELRESPRHPKLNMSHSIRGPFYNRIFESPRSNAQSVFPTPPKAENDHAVTTHTFDTTFSGYETFQLKKRLQDAELHAERLQAQLFECNAIIRSLSERQQHAASILLSTPTQSSYISNP